LGSLRGAKCALSDQAKRNRVQIETRCPLLTRIMNHGFAPMLVLALWLPSPVGYAILLGFAVCMGTIWAVQTSGAGKYFGEAGYATVPCKVKYEN
jgi:hypothetical protein